MIFEKFKKLFNTKKTIKCAACNGTGTTSFHIFPPIFMCFLFIIFSIWLINYWLFAPQQKHFPPNSIALICSIIIFIFSLITTSKVTQGYKKEINEIFK